MRIMIPTDENKESVCIVFARAPYFALYDTTLEKWEFLENPATKAHSGAGVKAAQFIVNNKADALVTVRVGENSAEIFNEVGIKIYHAKFPTIQENIDALFIDQLEILTQFHGGFHGHV